MEYLTSERPQQHVLCLAGMFEKTIHVIPLRGQDWHHRDPGVRPDTPGRGQLPDPELLAVIREMSEEMVKQLNRDQRQLIKLL